MLFFLLFFLFPVAIYCAVLSAANRRTHPLMIHGVWDTVGLLMACSGMLLGAGPAILSGFYQRGVRDLILSGAEQNASPMWMLDAWSNWWLLWGVYYGAIVVGGALLLYSRRRTTVIYNITPGVFYHLLAQALDSLVTDWTREGNDVFILHESDPQEQIVQSTHANGSDSEDAEHQRPQPQRSHQTAVSHAKRTRLLTVEAFLPFHNITLHWDASSRGLREQVEGNLHQLFLNTFVEENPASNWFLSVAFSLFALMFVTVVAMIVATLFFPAF